MAFCLFFNVQSGQVREEDATGKICKQKENFNLCSGWLKGNVLDSMPAENFNQKLTFKSGPPEIITHKNTMRNFSERKWLMGTSECAWESPSESETHSQEVFQTFHEYSQPYNLTVVQKIYCL